MRAVANFKGFLRSRGFWFLLLRIVSNGFGFIFMAVLARIAHVEELAVFVAAYAFASLFEPLFASSVSVYIVRLMNRTQDDARRDIILRSSYLTMQAASILLLVILITIEFSQSKQPWLSSAVLLSILYTPMSIFALPLRAKDDYHYLSVMSLSVTLAIFAIRLLTLIVTKNLVLAALLIGLGPVVIGILCIRHVRIKLFAQPFFSARIAANLLRQTPSLMGAMFLGMMLWRMPVLLAQWQFEPITVVHFALAMQLITGLCIVPNGLLESLLGPMSLASGDDRKFRHILHIASAVSWVFGLLAIAFVVCFGDIVLRFVFGAKAEGAGALASWLSVICLANNLHRIIEMLTSLKGRPVERVATGLISLAIWAAGIPVLFIWHNPLIIAIATSLAMLTGAAIAPFFLPRMRFYAMDIVAGSKRLFQSKDFLRQVLIMFLKG